MVESGGLGQKDAYVGDETHARGYKRASQSDYFDEYDREKNKLSILDEWIHYGNEWLG